MISRGSMVLAYQTRNNGGFLGDLTRHGLIGPKDWLKVADPPNTMIFEAIVCAILDALKDFSI